MDLIELREGQTPRRIDQAEALPEKGLLWIDLDREEAGGLEGLARNLTGITLHERHVADAHNTVHPSFYDGTSEYEILIFRSLAPEGGGAFETRATVFLLLPRLLLTIRSADSRSVQLVKDRLLAGQGRIPKRPIGLTHLVLTAMVDRFLALREPLAQQIEQWRHDLIDPDNPFDDWMTVLAHRSQLRKLERLCEEQEDALITWRDETDAELDDHLAVRLADLLEHVRRVKGFASEYQAEVESLVQLHFSAVAHRTNEIMRVLTIVSAIFLPLSLVAGIFGMNFENMPELKWHYSYFFALGGMAGLGIALLLIFRARRWL